MSEFYGGEKAGPTHGGITGGHYVGPEARVVAPWKCPSCSTQNSGPLELGCVSCGAGAPGYHVGQPPPPARAAIPPQPATIALVREDMSRGLDVYAAAEAWAAAAPPETSLTEAFVAGYLAATLERRRTQSAPAATDLDPAKKEARTLLAALGYFRDHILALDPDEIRSGEWCSIAEVDALIATLEKETA